MSGTGVFLILLLVSGTSATVVWLACEECWASNMLDDILNSKQQFNAFAFVHIYFSLHMTMPFKNLAGKCLVFSSTYINGAGSIFGFGEEAPFSVQKTHQNFVVREYPAQKWVCTEENRTSVGMNDSSTTIVNDTLMFLKLVRYITGQNSRSKFMPFTLPVTTEFSRGKNGTDNYTMCVSINKSNQADPPAPIDNSTFIQPRETTTVYTRTVPGYVTSEAQWMEEAAKLAGFLKQEGISVSQDRMYWVSYGLTFRLFNPRSEVWLTKEQ